MLVFSRELNMILNYCIECWASDSHARPGFAEILLALDEVRSTFAATPHESFHTMQEDWRLEIEQVLHGLRMKEKVYIFRLYLYFAFEIRSYSIIFLIIYNLTCILLV